MMVIQILATSIFVLSIIIYQYNSINQLNTPYTEDNCFILIDIVFYGFQNNYKNTKDDVSVSNGTPLLCNLSMATRLSTCIDHFYKSCRHWSKRYANIQMD